MARDLTLGVVNVTVEDEPLHSNEHPFCSDLSCPCHSDEGLIDQTTDDYVNGLMTAMEAIDYMAGRTF